MDQKIAKKLNGHAIGMIIMLVVEYVLGRYRLQLILFWVF